MPDIDFFDDEHVEESWNLSRTLHSLQPHANNPVLRPTEPWESLLCAYGSVLRDEQLYRVYYTLWWLDPRAPFGCNAEAMAYACSHDGIHWTKPDLGLIEQVNGGRNNLIHYGRYADQPCVLRLAEARDDKHYVMLYYGDFPPLGSGVRVCYSSDGIRWDWPGEMLWQTNVDRFASEFDFFAADDTMTCYFDANARKYVILRKVMQEDGLWPASERKENWSPDRFRARRVIARAESSDLKTLDDVRIVLAPDRDDSPGVDFHRLCVVPFRQRYLGLLEIHNGIEGVNSVDVDLVYSRCGKNWVRVGRWQGPFIPRGAAGTWNEGVVFTPSGAICFDTRTYLYYGGMQARLQAESLANCQSSGIGLSEIVPERLCSLRSLPGHPGLLMTKPVRIHESITINSQAKDAESLRVALLDSDRNCVDGFDWDSCDRIPANAIDAPVTWNQQSRIPQGEYRIGVRSEGADLFSFTIR